jgi:hypothetical protein
MHVAFIFLENQTSVANHHSKLAPKYSGQLHFPFERFAENGFPEPDADARPATAPSFHAPLLTLPLEVVASHHLVILIFR